RHTRCLSDWSSDVCSSDLGRKKVTEKTGYVPHVVRPSLSRHSPVHVTMRAEPSVPSLRTEVLFRFVAGELRRANGAAFQIVHFRSEERRVGKECRSWWWGG